MRLAWPLNKDDTQIREGFHNFKKVISFYDLFKDTFALPPSLKDILLYFLLEV